MNDESSSKLAEVLEALAIQLQAQPDAAPQSFAALLTRPSTSFREPAGPAFP
jgi:hypothetical protein